jgi:hypothetical protein
MNELSPVRWIFFLFVVFMYFLRQAHQIGKPFCKSAYFYQKWAAHRLRPCCDARCDDIGLGID